MCDALKKLWMWQSSFKIDFSECVHTFLFRFYTVGLCLCVFCGSDSLRSLNKIDLIRARSVFSLNWQFFIHRWQCWRWRWHQRRQQQPHQHHRRLMRLSFGDRERFFGFIPRRLIWWIKCDKMRSSKLCFYSFIRAPEMSLSISPFSIFASLFCHCF